jgi:soluble lytic murein transglycosylase-like protein
MRDSGARLWQRAYAIAITVAAGALCDRVHAVSDPIYATPTPSGKISYTNTPKNEDSRVLFRALSAQVWAFRKNFRGDAGEVASTGKARRIPVVSAQLNGYIERAAREAGLDVNLVRAVILVESAFQPTARSHANARGLMQVIPATGRRYGVHDLFDPQLNLYAGTRYLADLLKMFNGNVELALAGYNAGEGAVIRHGRRIPPFAETQAYVPAVLAAWRQFKAGGNGRGVHE